MSCWNFRSRISFFIEFDTHDHGLFQFKALDDELNLNEFMFQNHELQDFKAQNNELLEFKAHNQELLEFNDRTHNFLELTNYFK